MALLRGSNFAELSCLYMIPDLWHGWEHALEAKEVHLPFAMTEPREVLNKITSIVLEYHSLNFKESPHNEPYKWKYAARDKLVSEINSLLLQRKNSV